MDSPLPPASTYIPVVQTACASGANTMTTSDEADLEAWVGRAVTGDAAAWQLLWGALEPRVMGLLRNPAVLGRLAGREDDCRTIVVVLMERLRAHDFQRLRSYLTARAERPGLKFMPWLTVVAKRTAIDCMRAHPDYLDRRREPGASAAGAWIVPGSLPPSSQSPGTRPPMTNRATALELMRYAATVMPDEQRRALELWVHGFGFDDIAKTLALPTPKDAERLVRAGLERLRRHVREEDA